MFNYLHNVPFSRVDRVNVSVYFIILFESVCYA